MQAFFNSQFSYCSLVWMSHNRQINTIINNLHYRALRMVYQDEISSFEELLQKDGYAKIHHRNLQFLATEMYKVRKGIGPGFMKEIVAKKPNAYTEDTSAHTRFKSVVYNTADPKKVNSGLETLRCFCPKVWDMIPIELRNIDYLPLFKWKIKNCIPSNCHRRICKCFYSTIRLFIV